LYVEEDGSSRVGALVRSSEVTATSLIAYVEARGGVCPQISRKGIYTKGI